MVLAHEGFDGLGDASVLVVGGDEYRDAHVRPRDRLRRRMSLPAAGEEQQEQVQRRACKP
jgi:hypothetical protein